MAHSIGDAILLYEAIELPDRQADAFYSAMAALTSLLAQPPLNVHVSTLRMSPDLLSELLAKLASESDHGMRALALGDFLGDSFKRLPGVLLACPENHELARVAEADNRKAVWGGVLGRLGLTYRPEARHVVWHEALHLLGAKDCYELPDEGPNCGTAKCIMRYVPREDTVGEWPFLCQSNCEAVQKRVSNLRRGAASDDNREA